MKGKVYEFGPFSMDCGERVLRKGGALVSITPKAFDILSTLVEGQGRVLTKEELLAAVWPDTYVEESNLTFHISTLRKILSSESDSESNGSTYIETVPRRGYRFAASVSVAESPGPPDEAATTTRWRWPWVAAVVIVFAAGAGFAVFKPATARPIGSIAVLPLQPIGGAASDPLAIGLADAITMRLEGLTELVVRPTESVMRFNVAGQDPIRAGRALQVDGVLTGTIQRAGNRVRVAVQLIRVSDRRALWAQRFDADVSNLFDVEDAVSERIVSALQLSLSDTERKQVAKRYTGDGEAHRLYLVGRNHWYRWTADGMITAAEYFEQAIRKDPNYALAYVGLADALGAGSHFGVINPKAAHERIRPALEKAVAIDAELAEARIAIGMHSIFYDWDRATSEAELVKAVELAPNLAYAHASYAAALTALGKPELAERQKALELEPPSAAFTVGVGWSHFYSRDYDTANRLYREALKKDPGYAPAYWSLAESFEQQDRISEAVDAFEKSAELTHRSVRALSGLGHAYGLAGRRKDALAVADELVRKSAGQYVPAYFVAMVYLGMGERDRAFEWLERAYAERSDWIAWIHVHPYFDSVRGDPRFRSLEQRVGLWAD